MMLRAAGPITPPTLSFLTSTSTTAPINPFGAAAGGTAPPLATAAAVVGQHVWSMLCGIGDALGASLALYGSHVGLQGTQDVLSIRAALQLLRADVMIGMGVMLVCHFYVILVAVHIMLFSVVFPRH